MYGSAMENKCGKIEVTGPEKALEGLKDWLKMGES